MRRELRLAGALAVAIVAVAVPATLVARALPPRTVSELVATPRDEFPVVPVLFNQKFPVAAVPLASTKTGSQRLEVDTPHFPDLRGTRVELAVATYLRQPTQTIQIALLGPGGERLGSCRIPPSGYHDNAIVTCPVERPARLRRVVVTVNGQAPLGVYAAKEKGRLVAGALVRERRLGGLGARVRVLREWLGVLRPAFLTPAALFVLLALSIALLGAAVLTLVGADDRTVQSRDSG